MSHAPGVASLLPPHDGRPDAGASRAGAPMAVPVAVIPLAYGCDVDIHTLNPAQEELVHALRAAPDERPTFDPGLRDELCDELTARLTPLVPMLDTLGIV